MITTDQIRGPARRARLGGVAALRARRRGRRDAPGLRPLLPAHPPEPDAAPDLPGPSAVPGLPNLPDLVTPFVMETRADTLRAVGQLRSRLLKDRRAAIARLHAESVRVVTQYDRRGAPLPAALARYGEWIGAWRADAEVCRARAVALTHEANQRLACYWDAVWLTVHRMRAEEAGAARHRGRVPEAGLPARPALAARPEHWLPGRVTLDATWEDLDTWLFSGPVPTGAVAARDRTHAVARALQILDTQPHHDTTDAPGRGTR
ncbi:hypothetical protein [Streptomyces sp. NPDC046385]|uniref:hypothetical protein n=1 Tax=Streptomyces sp. NPDC046385 TaxID=3154918 RepID=UPI0033F8BA7B